MTQLHPFQQNIVDEYTKQIAAGVRRIIIVVPTGGGKTYRIRHHQDRARVQSSSLPIVTNY